MGFHFRKVEGSQTSVDVELGLDQITGLAILQTCKLFGIAEEKLALEPQLVEPNDLQRVLVNIGTEQQASADSTVSIPQTLTPYKIAESGINLDQSCKFYG